MLRVMMLKALLNNVNVIKPEGSNCLLAKSRLLAIGIQQHPLRGRHCNSKYQSGKSRTCANIETWPLSDKRARGQAIENMPDDER